MSCISLPSPLMEAAGFNRTWPLVSCLPPGRTSESCVHTEQVFGCIFPYGFSWQKLCEATGVKCDPIYTWLQLAEGWEPILGQPKEHAGE